MSQADYSNDVKLPSKFDTRKIYNILQINITPSWQSEPIRFCTSHKNSTHLRKRGSFFVVSEEINKTMTMGIFKNVLMDLSSQRKQFGAITNLAYTM